MNLLIIILSFLFLNLSHLSYAEVSNNTEKQLENNNIKDSDFIVIVSGMVCSFCAQGITRIFNKEPSVKSTKVDLDKMEVRIKLKKDKNISVKRIKKIIKDSGFSFVEFKS